MTLRTNTFRLLYRMRVIRRYLLPPMLNTTQLPTRLALAKAALTSPQECQETVGLLTWLYHAVSGPSASWWPGASQNCLSRALEMTRTWPSIIGSRDYRSSQNTN